MDLQQALNILSRVGAGETLSLSDVKQARDTIARQLHSLRGASSPDLDALTTLRESYFAADAAVKVIEEAEHSTAQEVENALSDIPDPDSSDEDEEDEEEDQAEKSSESSTKGKMLSIQEAVSRLGLSSVGSSSTQTQPRETDLSQTTSRVLLNGSEVKDPSFYNLAEAFRDASSRSLKTGKERVARIETSFAEERTLSGKINADTRMIDSFVSPEAVVAAGGCCSLPQPIYSNPVQGSTARPIRDSLTTLGATRGKFSFFPAICVPVDGVGLWTCEDDENVDESDPDTWKVCAEVGCDESEEVGVDAIYSCVTIGNYQSRFAPEQWQGYLSALAITHARISEVSLFTKMRDEVMDTYTVDALGSVFANVVNGVSRAAMAMRQEHRLGDIQLDYWVSESLRTAVRLDLVNRRVFGVAEDPNVADTMLATAFANEGINVTYSQDLDPITFGSGSSVPQFPTTFGSVLAPNGFYTFLDGGTLDLGTEIRDHNLNRQNKVAAFAESYEGLLARGCNALGLDIPVEICENVACPADLV